MFDELCDDQEVMDFLLKDCGLTKEDLEKYLTREAEIRLIGSAQADIFLSEVEMDQLFRVIRYLVHGTTNEDPTDAYDRAMSIL